MHFACGRCSALREPRDGFWVNSNVCVCDTGMQKEGQIPAVAMLALTALPGVLTKQFVNCVQLKNAMASLIAHDQQLGDTASPPKLD